MRQGERLGVDDLTQRAALGLSGRRQALMDAVDGFAPRLGGELVLTKPALHVVACHPVKAEERNDHAFDEDGPPFLHEVEHQ